MDDKLIHRVQYLAHFLFINMAEGKEFLDLMKALHIATPTFPQNHDVIEQHGGALGWAAYREGQLTFVRSIEALAQNYLDKLESELKTKE